MRKQGPYCHHGHSVRVDLLVKPPKYNIVQFRLAAHARCEFTQVWMYQKVLDVE